MGPGSANYVLMILKLHPSGSSLSCSGILISNTYSYSMSTDWKCNIVAYARHSSCAVAMLSHCIKVIRLEISKKLEKEL